MAVKIIVLFPSVEEATPFLLTEPRQPVFVTGTDPAEMAAGTVRAIRAKKPHLVLLAGTAAACDGRIPPGSVVEVVTERMAGGTLHYAATGPETGLPEAEGVTVDAAEYGSGRCGRTETQEETSTTAAAPPIVADREGAAFFAVCDAMETACCQIRAVTHRRGERPDPELERATLQTLAETLADTIERITAAEG